MYLRPEFVEKLNHFLMADLPIDPERLFTSFPFL